MVEPSVVAVPVKLTVCAGWVTVRTTFEPVTLPCAEPTPEHCVWSESRTLPLSEVPVCRRKPASLSVVCEGELCCIVTCQFPDSGVAALAASLCPPPPHDKSALSITTTVPARIILKTERMHILGRGTRALETDSLVEKV